jgi:hypothetical protein
LGAYYLRAKRLNKTRYSKLHFLSFGTIQKCIAMCKNLMYILFFAFIATSCVVESNRVPEPHLELGQKINFPGANPEKSYIIIGYREDLESKSEKNWRNQDYIVFLYVNDVNDVKEAVIHKNSILKY